MFFKYLHAFITGNSLESTGDKIFLPLNKLVHFSPDNIQVRDLNAHSIIPATDIDRIFWWNYTAFYLKIFI